MEITSISNELVKQAVKLQQKKYRTQTKKFLLEGYKAIKEAYDYGIILETIFVEKQKINKYEFAKEKIIQTNSAVIKKISTTESAPDAVAVGIQKVFDKNILKSSKKVLLLESIKDVGNLGTIIRSSAAFGIDAIVLYGQTVDLYNPKCVRAAVGNLWKIPIVSIEDFNELKAEFKDYERIATLPKGEFFLKNYKPKYPLLIMFGSEADGLSEELENFSTGSVKIEMDKSVESLNLAASVAIILYQLS